jgi:hypothetical protein
MSIFTAVTRLITPYKIIVVPINSMIYFDIVAGNKINNNPINVNKMALTI